MRDFDLKRRSPIRISGLFKNPVNLGDLADEMPLGLLLLDPERRVVFTNRAFEALTGASLQDSAGLPCAHVLKSRLCIEGCPVMKMTTDSGSLFFETDIIDKNRQLIPVLVHMAPVMDAEGGLAGFMETIEDLRPLKETKKGIHEDYGFYDIIGNSPEMEKLFKLLPAVAQSDSVILITGETGTGKDLLAESIHHASARAKGPFVKVNCGALPETLLESELFGHTKGAFTGAVEKKPGRFRLAHNGTLYLTEIGDLPLALQVKLLTFLDDKIVYPLGSPRGFHADVRVIAATHRDLEEMVKRKEFREDLMFRLNVVRLHMPPLRERGDDVRLLIGHFMQLFRNRFKKQIKGISKAAMKLLLKYSYPGNVRELRNIIEYAANVCGDETIRAEHLPRYVTEQHGPGRHQAEKEDEKCQMPHLKRDYKERSWPMLERDMIIDALIKAGGRKKKAAELLGWGRSTLWRKMKQYKIDS